MSKTIVDIIRFINVAGAYLKRHEKDESKLKYALKKVMKGCLVLHEAHAEAIEDLRIEHCSIDASGNILRDATGQYQFTKDGIRLLTKQVKTLREKPCEVKPFLVEDLPGDLADDEREAFTGFVLAETVTEADAMIRPAAIVITDPPALPRDERCPRCNAGKDTRTRSITYGPPHDVCGNCAHDFSELTVPEHEDDPDMR